MICISLRAVLKWRQDQNNMAYGEIPWGTRSDIESRVQEVLNGARLVHKGDPTWTPEKEQRFVTEYRQRLLNLRKSGIRSFSEPPAMQPHAQTRR